MDSEPAPMGVADFGVDSAAGVVHPYGYETREFQGNVEIDSMLTSGSGGSLMSFQLNTVVVFTLGATNFTYWIQDIASIQSSSKAVGFVDNIWNLSRVGAEGSLLNGEITGNGTVNNIGGHNWYADAPGASFAGNDIVLSYSANLSIRSVDSTIAGTPQIGFEYNDGFGWVTYDNVSFLRMHGAVNHGFVVDGFAYTPIGVFYDAEWDYTGSAADQHNVYSQLDMSLEYWNGHNLQAVPNAFNFGSDTGESLDNVVSALGPALSNGSLFSHLSNGSGLLGVLYNSTEAATLDVSSPGVANGTLLVNGTPTQFRGGAANLTLRAGTYNVSLMGAGTVLASQEVDLRSGTTTSLTLPPPTYEVQFEEVGLPSDTDWAISFNGTLLSGSYVFLNDSVPNGSYSYVVQPVPGFVPGSWSGEVPVAGFAAVIVIPFTAFNYSVTFVEFGLPTGASWSVNASGEVRSGTGTSLSFTFENGSYNYSTTTIGTFTASPVSGNFTVAGGAVETDVEFVLRLGGINGTVTPANATVLVDGEPISVADGSFLLTNETPATYSIEATSPGFGAYFRNVTVTPGNFTEVAIVLVSTGGGGPPPPVGSASPSISNGELLILVAGAAVVVVAALVVVSRRRLRRR